MNNFTQSKRLGLNLLLAMIFSLTATPAAAQVAKVNGVTIPQARADLLVREVTAKGRADSPELRASVKDQLIEREVISQEAVRLGLNKNPEVSAQIDLARQNVLIGAYLSDLTRKHPVTDDAMRKALERLKDSPAASEYKARHILVASEADAKGIITQIKGGADFAKIASEKSRDESTKAQGGALQWAAPGSYVRPFAEALARLKKGQMSDAPVQTNFGWHVIRVDDMRPLSFEVLKPQLQQVVQREFAQKAVNELRAKARIE